MTEKEPETDQEIYHEILATVKAKDKKIETLEQEMNKLKEMINKNAQEKQAGDNLTIGTCDSCGHPITYGESRDNPTCPYCHTGRTVSQNRT